MRLPITIPRFRFRTSTLLWLVVIVAAFFAGRQSDEIAARLKFLRAPAIQVSGPFGFSHQPDGRVVVSYNFPPTTSLYFSVLPQGIVEISSWKVGEMEIVPLQDGTTVLTLTSQDGRQTQADLVVKKGVTRIRRLTSQQVDPR